MTTERANRIYAITQTLGGKRPQYMNHFENLSPSKKLKYLRENSKLNDFFIENKLARDKNNLSYLKLQNPNLKAKTNEIKKALHILGLGRVNKMFKAIK